VVTRVDEGEPLIRELEFGSERTLSRLTAVRFFHNALISTHEKSTLIRKYAHLE
jgi:hypothetical protein